MYRFENPDKHFDGSCDFPCVVGRSFSSKISFRVWASKDRTTFLLQSRFLKDFNVVVEDGEAPSCKAFLSSITFCIRAVSVDFDGVIFWEIVLVLDFQIFKYLFPVIMILQFPI